MKKQDFINLFWISLGSGIFFFTFFSDEKTLTSFLINYLISFFYAFTLGTMNGVANDYLTKRFSWTEQTKKRTIIGIIVIVTINTIGVYACNYINFVWFQKAATTQEFFSERYSFTNWFMINFALMISAFLHAKGFVIELKKNTKQEVVEQKLIANNANAQFESLKNQLDPHFLFNSLNVLSALIDENPNQAQKFTASMSKIYRYVLEQKDNELVKIEDEIAFAEVYSELLKTRFDESVQFSFEINPEENQKMVVPLSLQLLLENCIKHNLATEKKPLQIRIYTEDKFLCVENNLQVREQLKESAGIGLTNIVQRYALLTSEHVFIEKNSESFKVKIPILIKKVSAMMNYQPQSPEEFAYQKAAKRVKELKGFYSNLISYCIVISFLLILNLITSPKQLWFYWPALGWGVGVAVHAMSVFAVGKEWEERKLREILTKENQQNGKN